VDDGATVVVVVVEEVEEDGTVVVVAEGIVVVDVTSDRVMPVAQDTPLSVEYSRRVMGAPLVLPVTPVTVTSPLLLETLWMIGGVDTLPALIS